MFFFFFLALLPHMVQRKQGKIVCVSSVAGLIPIPFRSSYAASQHALQAFCDSLRAEMATYNIQVLVCSPGYKATDSVPPLPPPVTASSNGRKSNESMTSDKSWPLSNQLIFLFSLLTQNQPKDPTKKVSQMIFSNRFYVMIKKIYHLYFHGHGGFVLLVHHCITLWWLNEHKKMHHNPRSANVIETILRLFTLPFHWMKNCKCDTNNGQNAFLFDSI